MIEIVEGSRAAGSRGDDRLDLARSIHDRVLPVLSGVLVALETGDVADEQRRCAYARELERALASLRAILTQRPRRPGDARERRPAEVLDALVREHGDSIEVEADDGWDERLPAGSDGLVEHFLSETVNNAMTHGMGGVEVKLRHDSSAVTIEVTNQLARRRRFAKAGGGVGLKLLSMHALEHGAVVAFGDKDDDRWHTRLVMAAGAAGAPSHATGEEVAP